MQYRKLGRTDFMVSEIGIGCEGFADHQGVYTKELIQIAAEAGVNYIDLYSADPAVRSNLGEALKNIRDKFILQAHLCTIWKNGQYERTRKIDQVKAGFDDLLRRLDTDYIDVGMIHYVDSLKDWEECKNGPVMEYALELKRKGIIRSLGLSSHNPEAAQAAVESGLLDVLMFSVNPCYDLQPAGENCDDLWNEENYKDHLVNMDQAREALYENCRRMGVGITVMKAFGGGDLLSDTLSPAGKALTPYQCIHYALTRPAVATVLVGAHTPEEFRTSIGYENASEEERDYAAAFASLPKISWQGHCMYCGHCAPCPKGIDVASVTKFLNLVKAQNMVPETVREHYAVLEHKADECTGCRACEARCPFGVAVAENMREAAFVFSKT